MSYLENSTLECNSCGYTLHGDKPSIVITCDDCIAEKEMFENMNTEDRLSEVISWITEDCWGELSQQSKARVIRQLGFLGISTTGLKDTKMKVEECKNAELDVKNKTALYLDDFDSLETWQGICKSFNVPIDADQIYFDAENITYC